MIDWRHELEPQARPLTGHDVELLESLAGHGSLAARLALELVRDEDGDAARRDGARAALSRLPAVEAKL